MEAIGLIGGTFNPIHYGHLFAAEEARLRFGLGKIYFIPCGEPVWKKKKSVLDKEKRFLLTLLAIIDNPYFNLSRVEIDKPGPSYTVETLRIFRKEYPKEKIYFITGLDALLNFSLWKEPEEILQLAELIAVNRPGFKLPEDQKKNLDPRIHLLDSPGLAISSAEIRERIRNGSSIRYLVPPVVQLFIEKENLYRKEEPE